MDAALVLDDTANSLEEYFEALNSLRYIHEFIEIETRASRAAETWHHYGRYLPEDLLHEHHQAVRVSCGRYLVYGFSVLESLSATRIAQQYGTNIESANNVLQDIGASTLEELVYHFGLIDSTTYQTLADIRGLRNSLAHGEFPHGLLYDDHDVLRDQMRDLRLVVDEFVTDVHGRSIDDIAAYIDAVYDRSTTPEAEVSERPTARLVRTYQQYGPEVLWIKQTMEELPEDISRPNVALPTDIEAVIADRGYNPEAIQDCTPIKRLEPDARSQEYSTDDSHIRIDLEEAPDLIGWSQPFELSFEVEPLDYYAFNRRQEATPPSEVTALLLVDGTVVQATQLDSQIDVGKPTTVHIGYQPTNRYSAHPTVQFQYGVHLEGLACSHLSLRPATAINGVPLFEKLTSADIALKTMHGPEQPDPSEIAAQLRTVRANLYYILDNIPSLDTTTEILPPTPTEDHSIERLWHITDELSTITRGLYESLMPAN